MLWTILQKTKHMKNFKFIINFRQNRTTSETHLKRPAFFVEELKFKSRETQILLYKKQFLFSFLAASFRTEWKEHNVCLNSSLNTTKRSRFSVN